jgi:hypothetical protein
MPPPRRVGRTEQSTLHLSSARWLLLGVILIATAQSRLSTDATFLVANGVSLAALALLLTRLKHARQLWAWIPLFIFLQGYYVKTYRMVADVFSPDFSSVYGGEYSWIHDTVLIRGMPWIATAFSVVCLTTWFALGLMPERDLAPAPITPSGATSRRALRMCLIVFLASLVACCLQAYLGFGVMGIVGARPAFGIGMAIVRLRTEVAPALLLLILWLFERSRSRRALIPLTMIVLLSVADTILRTSRGSLLFFMTPVLFLWILTRSLNPPRVVAGISVLGLTVLLHPLITAVRGERINYSTGLLESIDAALAETNGTLLESSLSSADHVSSRVSGADGVWFSLDSTPDTLSLARVTQLITMDETFGEYYTSEVYGLSIEGDYRAPGFVGTLMVIGGYPAVIVFSALYIIAVAFAWRIMSSLSMAVVTKAYVAGRLLYSISDNPFAYKEIVSMTLTCLLIEACWRFILAPTLRPTMVVADDPAAFLQR